LAALLEVVLFVIFLFFEKEKRKGTENMIDPACNAFNETVL